MPVFDYMPVFDLTVRTGTSYWFPGLRLVGLVCYAHLCKPTYWAKQRVSRCELISYLVPPELVILTSAQNNFHYDCMSYFARLLVLIVELRIAEQEHILLPFAINLQELGTT
jgi:hypothetical protein